MCMQKLEGVLRLLQRKGDDRRRQDRGWICQQFLYAADVGFENSRRLLDEVTDFRQRGDRLESLGRTIVWHGCLRSIFFPRPHCSERMVQAGRIRSVILARDPPS